LTREEVLLNSNRRNIYEYIKENPGTYSNKIVNSLDLSTFLVNWHIDMLLKFDFIRKERIGNFDAFYDLNTNPEYDEVIHIISRDKCSKIIEHLKENDGGCTKYQLTKELGMHPNTITKYVNKIDEFGLLVSNRYSNKVLYKLDMEKYLELYIN
jgi:predicted transcriptional regulator